MSFSDRLKEMLGQKSAEASAANEEFLKANAAKEGVTLLPSGLQYEVLQQGTGAMPGPTSRVTVHYEGKLTNGQVFDSSYKRGQPATFGVNQVISGWTEAMQLMNEGAKWRLTIPPDLGYGARGAGGSIPPNAVLIFDVELLQVQ
jgi:FKBP-type peptidyl-prolyl cis-trans isomerase FklB